MGKGNQQATCKSLRKKLPKTSTNSKSIGNGSRLNDNPPAHIETENEYLLQVLDLKSTCPDWGNLFSRYLEEHRRIIQWQHASTMGEPLLNKYAWAVPSNAAIKLLTKFSPLVEIGAGKGYWAHLVQQQGGYVLPFDITVPNKKEAWTKVHEGTPLSILSPAVAQNKHAPLADLNLFLCYPDQGHDVGLPSLDAFQTLTDEHNNVGQGSPKGGQSKGERQSSGVGGGGYIVHVGELLITGCISGAPQAPWGRTSSPDFQQRLFADYHCVLTLPLESFPFSRDFLTVWKRTVMFDAQGMEFDDDSGEEEEGRGGEEGVEEHGKGGGDLEQEEQDDDDDDDDRGEEESDEEESGEEENDDEWADLPAEERMPHTVTASAAPCMQHLLMDVLLQPQQQQQQQKKKK